MGKNAENNNKRWTREEDEMVRDLYGKTSDLVHLERALKRTRRAIHGRAFTLGVRRREASKEAVFKTTRTQQVAKQPPKRRTFLDWLLGA